MTSLSFGNATGAAEEGALLTFGEDTLRIRIRCNEGTFLIYDAANPASNPRVEPGYAAYWVDYTTERLYVFNRLVMDRVDVGFALHNLALDLGVDAASLAQLDPGVQDAWDESAIAVETAVAGEAAVAGDASGVVGDEIVWDETVWTEASLPLILDLMEFDPAEAAEVLDGFATARAEVAGRAESGRDSESGGGAGSGAPIAGLSGCPVVPYAGTAPDVMVPGKLNADAVAIELLDLGFQIAGSSAGSGRRDCCATSNPCCGTRDPCCDIFDGCCGSANPCCGSSNPCCGSSDPCCGSSNPCCGSRDPCCGNPDPCCGDLDPCCGDLDPCCGNPDPCCGDPDPCCGNPDPCCPITNPCDPICGDPCLCNEDPCDPDCGNPCICNPCLCDPDPCCPITDPCDPICGDPCLCLECDDGNVCNGIETCSGGACVPGTRLNCDDGDACNGTETCSPGAGCIPGTPLNCDDGNECTADSCSGGQCVNTPLSGAPCTDDGDPCTNDICVVGACTNPPKCGPDVVCCEGTCCAGAGVSASASSCCDAPLPNIICCPANTCCAGVCINDNTECCPGKPCTLPDGTQVCCGECDSCAVTGCCPPGGLVCPDGLCCNDGNPCTTDFCECADSRCQSYTCATQPACDDGNPCTTDACTPDACGNPVCSFPCLPDCTSCPAGVCETCTCRVPTATLTLNPSSIAATTAWAGMPANTSQSNITVTWDPPDCEGRLEIVELAATADGYLPPDVGVLTRENANLWRYDAFTEPSGEPCPRPVKVWIAAFQDDQELQRKSILVLPVHTYLTTGANTNFNSDYNYITWKYATVLGTNGGAFAAGGVTISANPQVSCGGVTGYACTTGTSVVFGTTTFTSPENQAASIIGHELVHVALGFFAGECPAYQWEADHSQQTGTSPCDTVYLITVLQYLANPQNCP